jgi:hypothetical protein
VSRQCIEALQGDQPPGGTVALAPAHRDDGSLQQAGLAHARWDCRADSTETAELAQTAIEYPPVQDPASFNLDAVKKKIDEAVRAHSGK